jgi:hypothetical protein
MSKSTISMTLLAAALMLAACGEKPQTAGGKKTDAKAWEGAQGGLVAGGWKVGDQASWEEQLRTRMQQGQNEYNRTSSRP